MVAAPVSLSARPPREASECRLWFFSLPDLERLPPDLARDATVAAAHKSLGYRGQARWKAGPMFKHPVFAGGARPHYIWWQDYDSYLPADVHDDPLRQMHDEDLVFGWTHWGTDSRATSHGFGEHARLYMHDRGLDLAHTELLREAMGTQQGAPGGAAWDGLSIMTDSELVRVDWFADGGYWDWFLYVEDTRRIWTHRWGDHIVRTLGVAMHLEDRRAKRLQLPYAHQDVCLCGFSVAECHKVNDPNRPIKGWRWQCAASP